MSGRIATFSTSFALGAIATAVLCARHCAYIVSESSNEVQQQYELIARHAKEVRALQDFMCSKGYTLEAMHAKAVADKIIK